jgi:hypothetical protein
VVHFKFGCGKQRMTTHDNLTGNKVVKKGKKQKEGLPKGVEKWMRKNTTKKQQKDMDRWIVKNL